MHSCPSCHTPCKPGAGFCTGCGSKIPTGKPCVSCRAPLAEGCKFCVQCGTKVEAGGNTCSCGTALTASDKFCTSCGKKAPVVGVSSAPKCTGCNHEIKPGIKFCIPPSQHVSQD
ncbi:hypothetical protein T484DRAFT_1857012 [Baffinella frigidus]|nr:hypothetical protein T484DRAFT_1857012 [Cryptophyta sp. CCMP2293]